jgi:hypothetical protein
LQATGKIAKGLLSVFKKTAGFAITQTANASVALTLLYFADNLTVDVNIGFQSANASNVITSPIPQPRP